MPSANEEVALYGTADEVVGSAPRARVRRDNLRHGATAVLVRDSYGRIYVHRRTDTKDVYPGLLDFAAGGVIQAGEDPTEAASREAFEELGVTGVRLEDVGQSDYRDEDTSFRAFAFVTTYDGPIRWQPEEVAWGEWVTVEALLRRLEHEPASFVADTPVLWGARLAQWAADRVVLQADWDSITSLVEGAWIDRSPQREEVATRLLTETRLLPLIADRLPLEVPRPVLLDDGRDGGPLRIRHRVVVGEQAEPARLTERDGLVVGEFLRQLHATGSEVVRGSGVPDADRDAVERSERLARLREDVLPLVSLDLQAPGAALLARLELVGEQRLTHGDLGPEHLLVRDGRATGVIDWGDARVTDPAIDLSWVLHGTAPAFARGVERTYGVSPTLRDRARDWHRLGPWSEALRGVRLGDVEVVRTGLRGVQERLAR